MDAEVRLVGLLLGVLLSIATTVQGVQQVTNPRIIEHPEDQFVAKNEPATLNCKAEGEPPPIITWYRDGRQVTTATENPKSHRMLLPSGQLFFLRIIHNKHNKPDVGVYYCNATNPETKVSVISKNATLEIAAIRDDFRETPKNTNVAVGDTAILNCRPPRGSPNPRVKWKKGGETLALNGRISLQDEGSLMIEDANKGDSGMYTCVATNIAASKETPAARLSVLEKPAFIILPQDVQEYAGQDIAFGCEASGDPPPTIIWKREDGSIPSGRSHIGKDRSLHIDNINVQDEGNYICRAENDVGHLEATARLSVHSQPSFIVTPKDKTVGVGRRVSLQCEVTGNPPPAVFWNRDTDSQNLMFPRQEHGRFSVQDDGTLVIEPVRKGDAGEYVCQAYSVAGTALAKARLEVKDVDPRPPPIIHQGPQNQTLPLNSVAMLQCASSGDPRPLISWMKNNRPLPSHDARITQLDSGTLQISDLKLSDTGMYSCRAVSETGETTWRAALVVESPTDPKVIFHRTPEPSTFPGPPSMPAVSDITETSMKLAWKANPNHGASPVFAYTVEYFSHETGEGWIVAADSISEQNYVVNNLRVDTAYMFLVRAQNSHGLSLPSSVTPLIRTRGGGGRNDKKPSLPKHDIATVSEKLTGTVVIMKNPEVVSSTAIKLNWEVKKSHRFIEGYHIKYRVMPDLDDREHRDHSSHQHHHIEFTILTVTEPGATMYVLRNLQKYTWYEIRIQPFYLTVEGQESNTVRVRTFEDVPSAPPQHISSKLVENNTLLLTWSPPPREQQNGALRGYRIYMVGNESRYNREIITNATTASVLVRHLVPNMPYRIQMAAFNKMGDGVKSDPHIVGGDGTQGLMHGFARQPWFIATLIGTVGGTLWFALCVFSVWLYRKRKARKKMNKNGVMNVPVHKSEDPSRETALRSNQIPMMSLAPTSSSSYPSNNNQVDDGNGAANDKQNGHLPNRQTSFSNRLMQASMAPDVTQGAELKEEKEPLYNTPSTTLAGMKTFNKAPPPPGPVSPYATTTLLQQTDSSAFRPIQPSYPMMSNAAAHDMNNPGNYAELPMETCDQCGDHLHSPVSECESMMDDPRYPLMGCEAPVLYLPPPPEQPPPSDMGSPPDSPTPRPRRMGRAPPAHYSDGGRHGGAPPPPSFRTMSPRMHAEMTARAYSPRAMSEPERGPTPPVRAYKLVPINEPPMSGGGGMMTPQQQRTHYSDTEAPLPPQRHSPPSPAPQDTMNHVPAACHMEEEEEEEYVGESDVGEPQHHDCDMDSNVAASWASDVASEGGEVASSISSSDGSFLAEADFASAVAKAAELSGLTVVGSTVSDPNAGQKEKKYRKHRERSKQRERPSSPYSTDSNYSSVPATRNPYPKSERKRQLQEHQRSNGKPRQPPPLKAKPSADMPSYNKPSYPTTYCPPPHTSGELRQNPLAAFDTSDTPIV